LFHNIFLVLQANRYKTLLILISLIFSITSIFLISSISNGVISMYSSMLKTDGDIIITQAKISDTFFSNVDINLINKITKISGINSVSAIIVGASPVETLPIVAIYGVSKNRFKNYLLIKNSYPKLGEVLVGQSIYAKLENKNSITIANKNFKVSGVFKSKIGFENGGVVLNIQDAGKIFNKSSSLLMVNINTDIDKDILIKNISKLSKEIDVKLTDNFIDNYNQFKIIKISSNTISFIAFCMGLLSIVSIMSISISQRQSEFGIKRALGISIRKIIFSIMLESFMIGVFSFICAYALSSFILFLIKNSTTLQGYVNGEIDITLAVSIFITTILMAMIGAILPALSAAKVDPIILIQGNRS